MCARERCGKCHLPCTETAQNALWPAGFWRGLFSCCLSLESGNAWGGTVSLSNQRQHRGYFSIFTSKRICSNLPRMEALYRQPQSLSSPNFPGGLLEFFWNYLSAIKGPIETDEIVAYSRHCLGALTFFVVLKISPSLFAQRNSLAAMSIRHPGLPENVYSDRVSPVCAHGWPGRMGREFCTPASPCH